MGGKTDPRLVEPNLRIKDIIGYKTASKRGGLCFKMPKHTTVNPERVQELEDKGGLRPDTLKKRAKALEDLDSFLKENHQISLDDALTNPVFELFLMQYFESLRVEVKDQNGVLREICKFASITNTV